MPNWDYIKKDRNSFYNKPEMSGHYWAKDMLDLANTIVKDPRLNKTKIQKYIIANSFSFDKGLDWHYFVNRLDKKYIAHVKHMLKRLNRQNVLNELRWLTQRTGMLRTPLEKALNVLAYHLDQANYLAHKEEGYRWYGLKEADAIKRTKELVSLMEKSLNKRWK